jgi:hypothetical protein
LTALTEPTFWDDVRSVRDFSAAIWWQGTQFGALRRRSHGIALGMCLGVPSCFIGPDAYLLNRVANPPMSGHWFCMGSSLPWGFAPISQIIDLHVFLP